MPTRLYIQVSHTSRISVRPKMDLAQLYKRFPTRKSCIELLEQVSWKDGPVCPYCGSGCSSPMPAESRHHCNTCNTSYSVTTKTVLHRTRIDLQRWFMAIWLILGADGWISARELARRIHVHRDTACAISTRIRSTRADQRDLLLEIIETCAHHETEATL